jgi:hypothetical protein
MPAPGAGNQPSRLPPLQWIAEERLVCDDAANEVHRPTCPRAGAGGVELERGAAVRLVWAPTICAACQPDVNVGPRRLTRGGVGRRSARTPRSGSRRRGWRSTGGAFKNGCHPAPGRELITARG